MKNVITIVFVLIGLTSCNESGETNSSSSNLSPVEIEEVIQTEERTTEIDTKIIEVKESENELDKALEDL